MSNTDVILVVDTNATANIICNDNLNPDVVEVVYKGEKGDKGDKGDTGDVTATVTAITNSQIEYVTSS